MNRNKIKAYAPQARRDFIRAVTDRAALYGLTSEKTEPVVERGDVAVIGGRPYPRTVAALRERLQERVDHEGFDHVMEAMAYTWFNRLVAIRYMELHGYLDHGFRVLSHPEGRNTPQIMEHAEEVDLPGLRREEVIDLKLAGNREAELYRKLLIAQCNALHDAMPFLFERIDDETELLLPDNLLQTDSIVRTLVAAIDEEDWQEVEIIGWIYQFYISEKKNEVMGKVVASEDIPAATQLFTPNWIVRYLVQNTLGRQWLATYPQSSLRQKMKYYVEPAEQTPEVQEQLKAITPSSLNTEELTLLDPACGSGHILVEAYDLFKSIYQERGYRARDIPALILSKNLFGLEIDDRAAQLAAFALMMKARADDRRIFESEAKPNILAFQDSQGMSAVEITHALNSPINKEEMPPSEYLFKEIEDEETPLFSNKSLAESGHVSQADIASLLALFENATTFGSLIQVPSKLATKLAEIEKRLNDVLKHGDLTHASAHALKPLLHQARFLAWQYDAVVANPPYMGRKAMNADLKRVANQDYPEAKLDLFAMFFSRCTRFCNDRSDLGVVIPFVWMFIDSYSSFRRSLLTSQCLTSLVQLEYNAFEPACVPVAALSVIGKHIPGFRGTFIKLSQFKGWETQAPKTLEAIRNRKCGWLYETVASELVHIPGSPIAYWISEGLKKTLANPTIDSCFEAREGLGTRDDAIFMRRFWEVSLDRIRRSASEPQRKWVKTDKAGGIRRWSGTSTFVMDWENDGYAIRNHRNDDGTLKSRPQNTQYFFRQAVSWGKIGSSIASFRFRDGSWAFNDAAPSLFGDDLHYVIGLLNSKVLEAILRLRGETLNYTTGTIGSLPFVIAERTTVRRQSQECIELATREWTSFEISMEFLQTPLTAEECASNTVAESFLRWESTCNQRIARMRTLEEANNRVFIEACGLQDELSPEVPDDQITLYRFDREEDTKRLLSYAIGCVMGRYSLDKRGLIYAHGGNVGFDPSQYKTFPADTDGIVPVTEAAWFAEDATDRFVEFVGVAWTKEHLEENLKFVADSLGPNRGESPRDTIRHYLAAGFFKHHLQTYKRRPIYWLFSSGKQRAFQCLVYLHRYHEGTLSRMRTEYVIPLQGMIASRIENLSGDVAAATSTAQRKKYEKEREILLKQQTELHAFDEKLRHVADQKITLDLDDGVKVNYGKFGDLLAEVKAVTGGSEEEG